MLTVNDIRVIDVETINNCNAGCALCLRHPGMRTNDTLDWAQVTAQVPPQVWQNLKTINFNGTTGDNIMHPDIFNIIEWTVNNTTAFINIHTNGSLRSTAWWQELGQLLHGHEHRVIFGIDGLEDTHEIYRTNTNWKKIISNAESFIQGGGCADWQFILFEHNAHQIEACRSLSEQLKFESFFVLHEDRFNSQDPLQSHLQPASHALVPQTVNFVVRDFIKPSTGTISCESQRVGWISIYADGTIWPCCWLMGWHKAKQQKLTYEVINYHFRNTLAIDFDQINLYTNTLEDIINGDLWQKRYPASFNQSPNLICTRQCSK
jgi:MoaA/NifB/PqqE/SkfB family radical SAM enzyme